mgnify:CR=1 FL=1
MTTKKLALMLAELIKFRQPRAVANFNEDTWPDWARMAREALVETVPHKTIGALSIEDERKVFLALRVDAARGPDHFVLYEALPEGTTRLTLYQRVGEKSWRSVEAHTWEDQEED